MIKKIDIWKHGKIIDLWSVVHFCSGFLLSSLFHFLGSNFWSALLFSLLLMVLWEVFEMATHIIEPSVNVLFDIIIGFLGFSLSAYFYFYLKIPFDRSLNILILALTLLLSLSFVLLSYRN